MTRRGTPIAMTLTTSDMLTKTLFLRVFIDIYASDDQTHHRQ
jgi:hypothetical protein